MRSRILEKQPGKLSKESGAEVVTARWPSASAEVSWLIIAQGAPIAVIEEGHPP